MSTSRGAGIPAIRLRTDATESADEWNKMRDAVVSIYESNNPISPNQVALRLDGFRPVARVDIDLAAGTQAGVGITEGTLRFLEVNAITTAAGDRNKAVEVIPTLDGTALDAETKPRKYLAAGDYEAWVVFREMGDTHEARIVFAVLDAGPGTLDRDEKAERLATFEVDYPDGIDVDGASPGVIVKKQLIRDQLPVPTERHQFKVRKTADDKVKVDKRCLVYLKGLRDRLVRESLEAPQSAEITVTGNGSIWLSASWSVYQHSQSTASSGIVLRMYRLDSLGGPAFSFRSSAPTRGTDSADRFSSGTAWFEIAKVELVGGEAFVTDQIVNGPIYVNELVDGYIS